MPPSSVLETIHAQSDQADNQPKPRKHANTKRTGELAEAAFVVKAASLGYGVCKPWGDSERYDFILDSGPRTWRVQIKCTECVITSPPYLDVTNFEEDQWLRLWFLGGPPYPTRHRLASDDRHMQEG